MRDATRRTAPRALPPAGALRVIQRGVRGRVAVGFLATDATRTFEMEKQPEKKNICSLDEFIQSQGLVDWPVMCEQNLHKSSSHLYKHSAEICQELKDRIPFPSAAAESLKKDLQTLGMRVKLQNSIFTQTPD